MFTKASTVERKVKFIKTYYLAKLKMGEAQYYRQMPEDQKVITLNTPSQYVEFHRIIDQYDNKI